MSISDADEQKVREWLRHLMEPGATTKAWASHAATILALLDRRVMPRPEEVPQVVLLKMLSAHHKRLDEPGPHYECQRAAYRALYDWATKREPVKVEAWAAVDEDGIWAVDKDERTVRDILAHKDCRIVHLVEADHD
jgi:hypothetical protein